jgi:hypothetical protein
MQTLLLILVVWTTPSVLLVGARLWVTRARNDVRRRERWNSSLARVRA